MRWAMERIYTKSRRIRGVMPWTIDGDHLLPMSSSRILRAWRIFTVRSGWAYLFISCLRE